MMTDEPATTASPAARSSRAVILARIREALRVPAPPPHMLDRQLVTAAEPPTASQPDRGSGFPTLSVLPAEAGRPWLPDGGVHA